MLQDMPERFEIAFDRDFDPLRIVGLFNFDDEAKDLTCPLPDGRWHVFELWSERYLGAVEHEVALSLVEPHGCRVLALRPATGRPALVGTNAHIGVGALDVTDVRDDGKALVISLGPAGRRHRKVFLAPGDQTVTRVLADGVETPIHRERGVTTVALSVDASRTLRVEFG